MQYCVLHKLCCENPCLEEWLLKATDKLVSGHDDEFLREVGFVRVKLNECCSSCTCAKLVEEF